MLISNSTPISIAAITPEMPADGIDIELITVQQAGDLSSLQVNNQVPEQPFLEVDFETILNQQLQLQSNQDDIVQTAEKEVITGLSAGFDVIVNTDPDAKFEFSLSATSSSVIAGQQYFTESDNKLSAEWASNIVAPIPQPEDILISESAEILIESPLQAVVASLIPADPVNQGGTKIGEKLPPSRQPVSAVVPALNVSLSNSITQINYIEPNSVKSMDDDALAAGANLLNPATTEADENSLQLVNAEKQEADEFELEKFALKKLLPEQVVVQGKEGQTSVLAQQAPLSMIAPQSSVNPPQMQALPTLQLSPQAPATQWGEALGERVSLALNKQLNSAEIRLDPPHLGKLDIQIQIKDDSATVMINTQHAHTRDLIESASVRLKEFLQDAGYSSVNVDVSHREQSMAQGDFFQQDNNAQNDNNTQQTLSSQDDLTGIQHSNLYLKIDDGRIDYFA